MHVQRHHKNRKIVIFTRYPEPGKVKSRLIPHLGETHAARVHKFLAEKTMRAAIHYRNSSALSIIIYYSGGNEIAMKNWLGKEFKFVRQTDGDIGHRMYIAMCTEISSPQDSVVLVGSDIPDLTAEIYEAAFNALQEVDIVLGPAEDGGYYLVGMNFPPKNIFSHIEWGTDKVLQSTLRNIDQWRSDYKLLKELQDIDTIDDLVQFGLKYE